MLYAFTTEDRSYQFPPPGLTLHWFAVAWARAGHLARAAPVARGRRRRDARRARPRHARRRRARAHALLRPRGDHAPARPADRAARHHHRHRAALGLQPAGHPLLVLDHRARPRDLLHRRRLQQRRRAPAPHLARRWSRRRWTSAPTASRPSATSCCPTRHRAARRRHAGLRAVLRRGHRHHLHRRPADDAADLDAATS